MFIINRFKKNKSQSEEKEKYKGMKPLIKRNSETGEMVGGFLDTETGEYHAVIEICDERDIDSYLEEYDITAVMVSSTW